MTDAPKRIWATINGLRTTAPSGKRSLVGGWDESPYRPDRGFQYILATPESLAASPEVQALIAAAVEKERAAMRQWCGKRVGVVQRAWKRAAEKALRGDLGDLRNRVDMMDEPPMEIVQSAAAIRAGKE